MQKKLYNKNDLTSNIKNMYKYTAEIMRIIFFMIILTSLIFFYN